MNVFIIIFAIFGLTPLLLGIGYIFGKRADRKHTQELQQQFAETDDMLVTQLKSFPLHQPGSETPQMVVAEVVVGTDYLKTFAAAWTTFFGGELHSYQGLMTRARLDVLVRLQLEAQRMGYNAICNVRFLSADVGGATSRRGATAVAMIAHGTAYQASIGTGPR